MADKIDKDCLINTGDHDCNTLYNCCDCGGAGCGCSGCWSCNACEHCIEKEKE